MTQDTTRSEVITEKMITDAICNDSLKRRRNNWVMPNVLFDRFECDVLEVSKAGYTTEYEVKISRGDYLRDCKKTYFYKDFYRTINIKKYDFKDRVSYLNFVVPLNLISVDEVPDFAGLIYYQNDGLLQVVKKPKKIRETPLTQDEWVLLRKKLYFRFHKLCGHYNAY